MAENRKVAVNVLEDPRAKFIWAARFLIGLPLLGIGAGIFALDEGPIDLVAVEKYGLSEASTLALCASFVYLAYRFSKLPVKQRKERVTTWTETETQIVQVPREKREEFWE